MVGKAGFVHVGASDDAGAGAGAGVGACSLHIFFVIGTCLDSGSCRKANLSVRIMAHLQWWSVWRLRFRWECWQEADLVIETFVVPIFKLLHRLSTGCRL